MNRAYNILIITLLFITSSSALGATYRWVDENGVTHYTQTKPPTAEVTEITLPPPPAISPEEARRKLKEKQQGFADRREDEEIKKEEKQINTGEQERKKKNCVAANNNLDRLQKRPTTRWKQDDGSYKRYSKKEREGKIKEARDQVKEYCN